MSDPLRPARSPESDDSAGREARIEELLLAGLDNYFAGRYEQAINFWTRVVFLERRHDRARAYIERARSALAERQRESEEYLHGGVSAYNAGDIDTARDLLTRAREKGSEGADVFLDRLSRVGTGASGYASAASTTIAPVSHPVGLAVPAPARRGWGMAVTSAVVVAVVMLIGGLPLGTWLSELLTVEPTHSPLLVSPDPLPIVRVSDVLLDRARSLHADGRLRDALRTLDEIRDTGAVRAEVERLRADVQRDLLAAAGLRETFPVTAGGVR